jgi:hypothetical protein
MTFDNRLEEFNFHLETMTMLKNENDTDLVETMESVGFSKQLTQFLLETNPTYFNGVMLRLKLYAKRNMNNLNVKNELKMHTLLHPLVDYLFTTTVNTVNNVKPEVHHEVKSEVKLEVKSKVADIQEKVVDTDDEESEEEMDVNHFDRFYKELVVEDPSGMLKSKEVYDRFVAWYEDNVDSDVPSKDELKDFLTDKLGKGDKKGWKGVSLSA